MIKLDPQILTEIRSANSPAELHRYLQAAVKLEHSTIPPYLTAMFSLKPGVNHTIAALIRSIVVEEMLHMTIAANILIAIGGTPEINKKGFVPNYPGPLPMSIGDLIVGIEAFSIPLVENTFMAIEEPEDPIHIQPPLLARAAAEPSYATIGQFYDAIEKQILELGPSIFVKKTAPPQVINHHWFPPSKLFPITGPESACKAIEIIKTEGEGTATSPFQSAHDPAHYYKFGEIANGRRIVRTPTGFAYAGEAVLFDPAGVWPLKANCKIADFPQGTQARTRIERFAYSYSTLLNSLHETFNGHAHQLNAAIGMMYDLRVFAVSLMETDAGTGGGLTVGPSYEYVDTSGGMPA
jgi:hypothetical protein